MLRSRGDSGEGIFEPLFLLLLRRRDDYEASVLHFIDADVDRALRVGRFAVQVDFCRAWCAYLNAESGAAETTFDVGRNVTGLIGAGVFQAVGQLLFGFVRADVCDRGAGIARNPGEAAAALGRGRLRTECRGYGYFLRRLAFANHDVERAAEHREAQHDANRRISSAGRWFDDGQKRGDLCL